MKQFITLFTIVLMMISISTSRLHASHVAGMDLSLTCLGGNDYIIRAVLYRDCGGVPAWTTATFVVECTSNSAYHFTITGVPQKAGSGVEVTPICQGWTTKCSGGSLYGVQQYVYEVQVTLPACNHWRIGWSGTSGTLNGVCCRNYSNTVTSSTTQNAYMEVRLDNLNAPCASTPALQFAHIPVLHLCVGQTKCVNMGAIDPNGDSLVYELVTPMTNGNNGTLNWIPPFSAQQPFPSLPAISLDHLTGTLCMTPTQSIISPMAIRIQKWRNINGIPTLIGTTIRDIQVNAATCNNNLPALSGMDTTMTKGYDPNDTMYIMEVCVGESVQFAMWGFDADQPNPTWGNPDKFSISWNNGIPQGLFNTFFNNTDSAYATFSWTPDLQNVSNIPYCFVATIRDGACPFNGEQSYAYCFLVRGTIIGLGPDSLLCQGESITLVAATATPPTTYHWFVNGYFTGHPLHNNSYTFNTGNRQPGIYTISVVGDKAQQQICPLNGVINVNVVLLPDPDLGPDRVIYDNNPIILDAGPGAQYIWSHGATTQTTVVTQTGLYSVLVDGGFGTRCLGTDQVFIEFIIGVDKHPKSQEMAVTPNPTTGDITFTLPPSAEDQWSLQLYTTDGREVLRKSLPNGNPGGTHTLQLGHLTPGVYLLTISSGNRHYRSRVVVSSD
jgi:hypothetical protein